MVRVMKKLIILLVAFAALAGTASAATWTWTEVRAESWARKHVVYSLSKAEIAEAKQKLAYLKSDYDEAKAVADRVEAQMLDCQTRNPDYQNTRACTAYIGGWGAELDALAHAERLYYDALREWNASGHGHYRPVGMDCRGASPSSDAYHFYRFRCRAQFTVGWGDILITITGKNRAVWRWLP
jgi:hypothetical protein